MEILNYKFESSSELHTTKTTVVGGKNGQGFESSSELHTTKTNCLRAVQNYTPLKPLQFHTDRL